MVSKTGAIRIPAELRKKYNLVAGSEVVIVDYGGVLSIVPAPKDPIKQRHGMLKGKSSLTQALLEERAHMALSKIGGKRLYYKKSKQ